VVLTPSAGIYTASGLNRSVVPDYSPGLDLFEVFNGIAPLYNSAWLKARLSEVFNGLALLYSSAWLKARLSAQRFITDMPRRKSAGF